MSPKSVISCCNSQACSKVVCYGPHGSVESERSPNSLNTSIERNTNNEDNVEPVDMLVPVRFRDWGLGNVDFLWIVLGASVRFR